LLGEREETTIVANEAAETLNTESTGEDEEPSLREVEIALKKLKDYNSPGENRGDTFRIGSYEFE
jgi:hypothetical protein